MKTKFFFVLFVFACFSNLQAEVIVMLGSSGTGTRVQSKLLSAAKELPYISAGDLLRGNSREDTPLGKMIRGFIEAKELVPNVLVYDILFDRMAQEDCAKGFILEGFPKTLSQAEALITYLGEKETVKVFNLEATDDVIVKRLVKHQILHNRVLYTEKFIRRKLAVYHENASPIINFFDEKRIIQPINGNQPIEEVFKSIMKYS